MKTLETIFEAVGFVVCWILLMFFVGFIASSIADFFFESEVKQEPSGLTYVEEYTEPQYQVTMHQEENIEDGVTVTVFCSENYSSGFTKKTQETIEFTCMKK